MYYSEKLITWHFNLKLFCSCLPCSFEIFRRHFFFLTARLLFMSRSIWPQRLSHCSKLHVGAQQIYRKILFVNSCELVLSTECFGMILQVLADSQELEPKWFSRAATCGWGAICKVDAYDTNLRKWHQVFTDVFKDSCHLELEVYIYIYMHVYYIWLKFKVEQSSISNVNIQSSLAVAAFLCTGIIWYWWSSGAGSLRKALKIRLSRWWQPEIRCSLSSWYGKYPIIDQGFIQVWWFSRRDFWLPSTGWKLILYFFWEGSHIPDTSRHFFESIIFRFSLFGGIFDASSPKDIHFGKGTLSFIEGSVYLSGN